MTNEHLRVGIISFAHVHAPAYAHALQSIADASLAGIWDEDVPRGQAGAGQFGTVFFDRLEDLLAAVDTVIVASENTRHRDFVLAAAAARVPVLCEKPLATTLADAHAMIDACAAAGVLLGTAFPVRYADAMRGLRDAVRGGVLGDTLMIRATNQGRYPGGWFGDPALAGGGALADHIVHVADLLRWIWGAEFRDVYAEAGTRFHDLPVDDCGMLLITLDNGVSVSLDPSWSRPVAAWPTWGGLTLEATGTTGVISVDAFAQNVEVFGNTRGRGEWRAWGDNLDKMMLEDWLRAVRSDGTAPISGEDGLRALELVLAAYRSAESHEPVVVTR